MKKRLIATLLAIALTAAAFAGCTDKPAKEGPTLSDDTKTSSEDSAPEKEAVTLKIHTIINQQTDEATVFEAINKMTQDKLNTTVNYVFHGGSYADKIQMIIGSGEEYDACFTSNWVNLYNTNVAKGAFVDITEMLSATPKLKETIPDYFWNAAAIKGHIYAIPNQQIAARAVAVSAPKDYVDGVGADINQMKALEDAQDYIKQAKEKFNVKALGIMATEIPSYCGYEAISDYLGAGVIKMTDDTAKVVNFYETPEWISTLNTLYDLNAKGLLDGQATYDLEYFESQNKAKKFSITIGGTYKPGAAAEAKSRFGYDSVAVPCGIPPYLATGGLIATMYGISNSSKNPQRTLEYFELLNTDSALFNTVVFGVEGVHYKKVGTNTAELIPDSGYSHGMSWAIGNVFNSYILPDQDATVWEETEAINNSAKTSPILGFSFDAEPVKMQLTSVSKVVKEFESIVGGTLPVKETNDELNKRLKVAGVDEVIAEMQRQVDEFMKTK